MSIVAAIRERIYRVGWSKTARLSGIDRVTLHRCFGEGFGHHNPRLDMIEAVLPIVGLELTVTERRP